ncbi:MAG: MaoC family dehydratase [Oscillospiraceae bacterium]|nr:MaoC family dehydratase [Oscillospiraceae bacterium]
MKLKVGQNASMSKTISESDVYMYAGITGDNNPAHVNSQYADNTMFHGRIAHGLLSAGLISAVMGTKLPGPGSIYISQMLNFTAPVRFGDTVTATVTVKRLGEKNRAVLETVCTNQNGDIVLTGEAVVMPPKRKSQEMTAKN